MKQLLTIPVVCALLLGNVPASAAEPVQVVNPNEANLVIYRPQESTNSVYYRIAVDGVPIGKLKRGKSINLKLTEGDHVISANDKNRTSQEVSVKVNGTTFVRGEVDRKQRLSFQIQDGTDKGRLTASLD